MTPTLEIVVVTWRGARDNVRACLGSLERHPLTLGPTLIHVVDNASGDGSVDVVQDEFPHVRLHLLDWNAGFCIANNTALRAVTAPYALVLNPDTEISAGTLDHLVESMRSRPDIGIAGCRLALRDGSFDHAAKRSFPTPLGALAHFTGLGRRSGADGRLAQYQAPQLNEFDTGEVDAVNGAFMLVRKEAMDAVGLFDEGYWTYMEDLDWCYRFKQAGWKVWYDGSRTILHVKGGTTKKRGHRRLRTNYFFHRGMARFYRKFYARNPLVDVPIYAAIWIKFLYSATRSALARRSLV